MCDYQKERIINKMSSRTDPSPKAKCSGRRVEDSFVELPVLKKPIGDVFLRVFVNFWIMEERPERSEISDKYFDDGWEANQAFPNTSVPFGI